MPQPNLSILIQRPPSTSSQSNSTVSFLAGTTVYGRLDIEIPALNGEHVERGIGQISIELVGSEEIVTRNEWLSRPLVQLKTIFQGNGLPPTEACHDIHFGNIARRQGLNATGQYKPAREDTIWVAREGKSSFGFSFNLPTSLPSSFSLHPTTSAPGPKSSTRAIISYVLIGRLVLATGLPSNPRLNELFTRREITVISTDILSPHHDIENDDEDNAWEHTQRGNSIMKVSPRTHIIDRDQGGSIALDVQMGTEEGCWVIEGEEVGLRVGLRNGCCGIWTSAPSLQLVKKTRLHLGNDHETGEQKIEEIDLTCIYEVYGDVMYRVPPLNNTSFDLSFVLPPDLRTITLCSTLSENPEEEDHIECSFEVVVRVGVDIDARAENEQTEATVKLPLWIFNPYHAPYRLQPAHLQSTSLEEPAESTSVNKHPSPPLHNLMRPSVHEIFQTPLLTSSIGEEGWSHPPVQYHQLSENSWYSQLEVVDPYTPQPSCAFNPFLETQYTRSPGEWNVYSPFIQYGTAPIIPVLDPVVVSAGPTTQPSVYGFISAPLTLSTEIDPERAHIRSLPWPNEMASATLTPAMEWMNSNDVLSQRQRSGVEWPEQDLDQLSLYHEYLKRSLLPPISTPLSMSTLDVHPLSTGNTTGISPVESRSGGQLSSSSPIIGVSSQSHSYSHIHPLGPRPLPIPPPAAAMWQYPIPLQAQTDRMFLSCVANTAATPPRPALERNMTAPLPSPRPRAFDEVGMGYIGRVDESMRAVSPVVEKLEEMVCAGNA